MLKPDNRRASASRFVLQTAVAALLTGCLLPNAPLNFVISMREFGARRTSAQILTLPDSQEGTAVDITPQGGLLALANPSSERPTRVQFTVAGGSVKAGYELLQSEAPPLSDAGFEVRLRTTEHRWLKTIKQRRPVYRIKNSRAIKRGDTESFWVIRDVGNDGIVETKIEARAAVVGERCVIFLDEKINAPNFESAAKEIANAFDEQIFPTNVRLFGAPIAPDGVATPIISLLLSPAVGNYGSDTTIGYFSLRDLFPASGDPDSPLAFSNERLILYISPFVVAAGRPADYLGTIAHELQHLINASRKLLLNPPDEERGPESLWLDEMLSMIAMSMNGYGIESSSQVLFSHVAGFLDNPGAFSLTQWDLNPEASAYGAAYLFGNYLIERLGTDLLKELVDSPEIDLQNLENRLKKRDTDFKTIFGEWALATILDGTELSDNPKHQYKNLDLLGGSGRRRLYGVLLDPIPMPIRASINLKPTSLRCLVLPPQRAGRYDFILTGGAHQAFLVVPQ